LKRRAAAPGRTKGSGADGDGGRQCWCWRPAELLKADAAGGWRSSPKAGMDRGDTSWAEQNKWRRHDGTDGIGWRGLSAKRARQGGGRGGSLIAKCSHLYP